MRDDAEIENAMHLYGNDVLTACLAYAGNKQNGEDAFQETFLKYALSETVFENENHRKAWLLRVAINICKDQQRKASPKDIALDETLDSPTSIDEDERAVRTDELKTALAGLPDPQRQALILTVVLGYSAIQAAEIMDMPVNTVYSHISRGKNSMRKALGDAS